MLFSSLSMCSVSVLAPATPGPFRAFVTMKKQTCATGSQCVPAGFSVFQGEGQAMAIVTVCHQTSDELGLCSSNRPAAFTEQFSNLQSYSCSSGLPVLMLRTPCQGHPPRESWTGGPCTSFQVLTLLFCNPLKGKTMDLPAGRHRGRDALQRTNLIRELMTNTWGVPGASLSTRERGGGLFLLASALRASRDKWHTEKIKHFAFSRWYNKQRGHRKICTGVWI